jgi:hypothetical protein
MIVLLKLLIIVAVVGLLRSSEKFRAIGRDLDEVALVSLKRMMRATEESGYPPETIVLLMALTAIAFMAVTAASELAGR